VPFNYTSGEEIKKGDRVIYAGEPSQIEFVADPLIQDSETDWYIQEYGGGVMIVELQPQDFGRVFLTETQHDEDLEFVSRSR
jgi:hypothetical protein